MVRPRQARYQAALRPDMMCSIDFKALSNFTPNPKLELAKERLIGSQMRGKVGRPL